MLVAALAAVQQLGDLADLADQLAGPMLQADRFAATAQFQARLAPLLDRLEEVIATGPTFALDQTRALLQRTEQQEGIEETRFGDVDGVCCVAGEVTGFNGLLSSMSSL